MIRLLLYSLVCLAAAIAAATLLKQDSGQVVFAFSDYAVQTSMGFFVILVMAGFFVCYMLVRLLTGILDVPENYRRWRKIRRHTRSEYYLTQGFLALTEGDWAGAEKLLRKGAGYSRLPMINYIGAARAAQQQGAIERRDSYLRQAYADNPDSEFVVGLTRAELQLKQHETEQAYATLRHIDADRPGQDQVKLMMLEASSELNDWQQSLTLLEDLERKGLMPVEKVRARQLQAYARILERAAALGHLDHLQQAWHKVPKKLRKEYYLIEVYIKGRLKYGGTDDCEVMLRRVIKHHPDPALVRLYGLVEGERPVRQLSFVEGLLRENSNDASLQLTAGRLYKRAGLWGKAIAALERSLAISPGAEAYYELATLYKQQGDEAGASDTFQKGLALAAGETGSSVDARGNIPGLPDGELVESSAG